MALENPIQPTSGDFISVLPRTNIPLKNLSNSHSIRESPLQRIPAHFDLMSPSDAVGPSPVTSNGTASTEIEDEEAEEYQSQHFQTVAEYPQLTMLETNIPESMRLSGAEESISVIHAPQGFMDWPGKETAQANLESTTQGPERDDDSNASIHSNQQGELRAQTAESMNPPPLMTNIKPVRYNIDDGTPRAQDLPRDFSDTSRGRPKSSSSLEKIVEIEDGDDNGTNHRTQEIVHSRDEIDALTIALQECWTLCNTLSNLSKIHRARAFNRSETPDAHEKAWKCCWKLCQTLYANYDESAKSPQVDKTLELCREFCQSLFDIRLRPDDVGDSVLRVSFELNNHLFSSQDYRTLPEAFRERTLEFYVTLCHRLMKQRVELTKEADSLLRACWSLAEMLFSLRQKTHQRSTNDVVDILESAIQACWQLCDIFREGWTSIRPRRNTPLPQQASFFSLQSESVERNIPERTESRTSNRSKMSKRESVLNDHRILPPPPETPVTEFDETPLSPDLESPVQRHPNIMVLGGTPNEGSRNGRWSSSASNMSGPSQSTAKASVTAPTPSQAEDHHVARIKVMILKLAVFAGFNRDATDGKAGVIKLQSFVMGLDNNHFGSTSKEIDLCQNYKRLVVGDLALPKFGLLPPRGKRVTAPEMAKSVSVMIRRSSQYEFLRDLYCELFSFMPEEVEMKSKSTLSIFV
ncbi:hypothetical protein BROUX41_001246 [Berkeleyomyces rouxiae]|uniref:uncharacterized protein n=1 Tax=Berkeleyomyces rouxiae TaxID=2035830 RepID=UPI003B794BA1